MGKPAVEVQLLYKRDSDKAIMCEDENGKNYWLPKSRIVYDSDPCVDTHISISMPIWLADTKGLKYEDPYDNSGNPFSSYSE